MMLARVFCKVWSGIANVAYPGLTLRNGFASKKYSLPWENFDFVLSVIYHPSRDFFDYTLKFQPMLGAFICASFSKASARERSPTKQYL